MKTVVNVMRYISDSLGALFLLMVSILFFIITTVALFIGLVVIVPIVSIRLKIENKELPISEVFVAAVAEFSTLIKNKLGDIVDALLES